MRQEVDSFDRDVLNYCNGISDGAILSGLYTRKAVERFAVEYTAKQKDAGYPYTFIPERANQVIAFAEDLFIPDIQKKLTLLPWMKFIYYNLYGWVHKNDTGKRRFRSGYVECARKNSKTTSLLFPQILYDFTHTPAAESYFVSKSDTQAEKAFQELKMIVQESFKINPRRTKITESGIQRDGSFIKFFSSGSRGTDAYKNTLSIVDEFHDYDNKGAGIITSFRFGSRAKPNSLLLIITSAGNDISSPCYAENEKAKKILNGLLTDDTYFTVIYSYDHGDDWTDPALFIKANPSLDKILLRETLRTDLSDALITPSHQADFKSKTCGIWDTGGTKTWIPLEVWEKLDREDIDWNEFEEIPCDASFDLSSINDFTAYTFCFNRNDKYYFKHRFYIPEGTVRDRYRKENINIPEWIEKGFVTAIPGPTIDYSVILEDIRQDMGRFRIREFAYDNWNSNFLIRMLESEFPYLALVPYPQNLKKLSAPTKQYEKLVYEKKIVDTSPVMKWMITNAEVKADPNGNYKPLKEYKASTKRIDGVITSIISLDMCIESTRNSAGGISFEDALALL
jgi:phage terminase large subunit-like protein